MKSVRPQLESAGCAALTCCPRVTRTSDGEVFTVKLNCCGTVTGGREESVTLSVKLLGPVLRKPPGVLAPRATGISTCPSTSAAAP